MNVTVGADLLSWKFATGHANWGERVGGKV